MAQEIIITRRGHHLITIAVPHCDEQLVDLLKWINCHREHFIPLRSQAVVNVASAMDEHALPLVGDAHYDSIWITLAEGVSVGQARCTMQHSVNENNLLTAFQNSTVVLLAACCRNVFECTNDTRPWLLTVCQLTWTIVHQLKIRHLLILTLDRQFNCQQAALHLLLKVLLVMVMCPRTCAMPQRSPALVTTKLACFTTIQCQPTFQQSRLPFQLKSHDLPVNQAISH
mmetsp:Transcript_45618/g.105894  ORF Transcript_45618/g.105894 Transcript_45618/m.105894 type:complete len:228 (+) Transcript_45618:770-1453(+)